MPPIPAWPPATWSEWLVFVLTVIVLGSIFVSGVSTIWSRGVIPSFDAVRNLREAFVYVFKVNRFVFTLAKEFNARDGSTLHKTIEGLEARIGSLESEIKAQRDILDYLKKVAEKQHTQE